MAENIDLNINIGANVTDLQAQLQKAENLLLQFQNALKKATNVGEINYLNGQINNLNKSITNLNQQMNKVGRPTADATNALSNLSRVAQDAPYGFIGIANNLNPLLESFQRLKEQSGSSATALKSMVAGLTGPAGIGLALGVVSSLAVTYSKEIAAFFQGPEAALKSFKEELNKLNAEIYKNVGTAQANRSVGLNLVDVIVGGDAKSAANSLARLKDLFRESAAIQNAKIGQDKSYYASLVNLAATQQAAIGNEKNNQTALGLLYAKQKEILGQRNQDLKEAEKLEGIFGFPKAERVKAEKMRIGITYKDVLADLDRQISEAKTKNREFIGAVTNFEQTGDTKKTGNSPIVNYAREENKELTLELAKMKALRDKMKAIGLEPIDLFKTKEETTQEDDKRKTYFNKQNKDLLESTQKEGGFGNFMQKMYKDDKLKIDEEEGQIKRLKELTKAYNDFAYTISTTVTEGLMSMWDAMQSGESPLKAIGDMFMNIAKQIAAAVIQALIFKALLDAFPELKGAFAAMGAVSSATGVGKLLGLASGGVVTGPTLAMIGEGSESEAVMPLSRLSGMLNRTFTAGAMNGGGMGQNGQFVLKGNDLVLALQRSNSSLNIRRG